MKFHCKNENCHRPSGEYDETEFSHFLFSLSINDRKCYLECRLCPECFNQTKPRILGKATA